MNQCEISFAEICFFDFLIPGRYVRRLFRNREYFKSKFINPSEPRPAEPDSMW